MSLKKEDNFGIIDIGSNTVRGVVYKNRTPKKGSIVFRSDILEQTCEGVLSYDGIKKLLGNIKKSIEYFKENGCTCWYAFATSAMRDVKNFGEVFDKVKSETGIEIELISGDEEAECDFRALLTVCPEGGIGVDLGGGSAQVIAFDKNGVIEAKSFPIGVKRMKQGFTEKMVPTPDEAEKIEKEIKSALSEIKSKSPVVWFMGGTAKAVAIAASALFSKSEITPGIIDEIYEMTSGNIGLSKKLFNKRYQLMPTGLKVMKAIAESVGAEVIRVTDVGVRDGYVERIFKSN